MQNHDYEIKFKEALGLYRMGQYAASENKFRELQSTKTSLATFGVQVNDPNIKKVMQERQAQCEMGIAYALLFQGFYESCEIKLKSIEMLYQINSDVLQDGLLLVHIFKNDLLKAKDNIKHLTSVSSKLFFEKFILMLEGKYQESLQLMPKQIINDMDYFSIKIHSLAYTHLGMVVPEETRTIINNWASYKNLVGDKHTLSLLAYLLAVYQIKVGQPMLAHAFIEYVKALNRNFEPIHSLVREKSQAMTGSFWVNRNPLSRVEATPVTQVKGLLPILTCKGMLANAEEFIAYFAHQQSFDRQQACLLFPGNNRHINDNLHKSRGGSGLAKLAATLTGNGLCALSLPTVYKKGLLTGNISHSLARSALAMMWYSVGLGKQLILPVRERLNHPQIIKDEELAQLHDSGLINLNEEPSFLGGAKSHLTHAEKLLFEENGRPVSLLEFYFNNIAELYLFIKQWNSVHRKYDLVDEINDPWCKLAFKLALDDSNHYLSTRDLIEQINHMLTPGFARN